MPGLAQGALAAKLLPSIGKRRIRRVADDKRPSAAFAQQRDLIASCRADPAQSPQGDCEAIVRRGGSEADERRSRLTATGRRGWAEAGTLRVRAFTSGGSFR